MVSLLGLVGTPPTAVFLGKLQVFTAAIDGGYGWLAVLAVANTVASLFYYLRWLAPAFLPQPGEAGAEAGSGRPAAGPPSSPKPRARPHLPSASPVPLPCHSSVVT